MNIFIITEGNSQTGYGHLTRCLSMYQGLEERGLTPHFIANCDENGKNVLEGIPITIFDWTKNPEMLMNLIEGADIAFVDSYLAELPLYVKINHSVKRSVYFDDTMRLDYPAGIIINGAVNAERLPYKENVDHTLLLGFEYMPMRKPFWDFTERNSNSFLQNVLITFGGNDNMGVTIQILEAIIEKFPHLEYHVVLGFRNNNDMPEGHWRNTKFYRSLNANEMCDLMLKCDLAISAAGQTTYELIRTKTPSIFVQIVENQHYNIKGWYDRKVIGQIIKLDDKNYLSKIIESINNYPWLNDIAFPGQGVAKIIDEVIS
jgi:UDP-2,4-diacetamido-2,4,6-trideoxy-beta-L-altropyranose hydrolase